MPHECGKPRTRYTWVRGVRPRWCQKSARTTSLPIRESKPIEPFEPSRKRPGMKRGHEVKIYLFDFSGFPQQQQPPADFASLYLCSSSVPLSNIQSKICARLIGRELSDFFSDFSPTDKICSSSCDWADSVLAHRLCRSCMFLCVCFNGCFPWARRPAVPR